VEFELKRTGQNAVAIETSQVLGDTWEAFYSIPSGLPDGTYTLTARLYNGQTEVANTQETITVNHADIPPPPPAETVEMTYPSNGGTVGFFIPRGKAPNTVLDVTTSDGAQQVRALYTTSTPGTDPKWTECGSGAPSKGTARI